MGQKQSGLTPKKIACLSKETHFSQNEIITWYQGTIYSKIKITENPWQRANREFEI